MSKNKDFIDHQLLRKAELEQRLAEYKDGYSSYYNVTPLQAEMLSNLIETKHKIGIAALKTKISRQTHYNWIESCPEYKRAVEDIKYIKHDIIELAIEDSCIIDRNSKTLSYYAETQLKDRGYTNNQDIDLEKLTQNAQKLNNQIDKIIHFLYKIQDIIPPEQMKELYNILNIEAEV